MIADVADALDHAHKSGVIHRDIKPSNLLLSPEGRLSVNDFGLARVLEQPGMTMTGEFVGTPAYMSPEQIAAGRVPIDHRTDVYSLGATLYELLTLQPPFSGKSRDQVLAQILQQDPVPPRKVNKRVPVDLETICLKAMTKDPNRRYRTAGQMAEDLRRYVNRFAISARRAGPMERLGKWVRRNPGLAAGLACALGAFLTAGLFAWRASVAEQRRQADASEHEEMLRGEKRQNALDRGLLAAMGGDFEAAEEAIRDAERLDASPGQVRVMRGQIALHRGQMKDAVRELEQAVQLLPESVAARGMLAVVHCRAGRVREYQKALADMEHLALLTPEDYLFKGYAQSLWASDQASRTLDEAIRRRPSSAISLLIAADARARLADDSKDVHQAELTQDEADAAKRLLRDNSVPLWVSVHAHLVAATIYEASGQKAKLRSALAQARRDARALDRFTTLPEAVLVRWWYARQVGEEDAAEEDAAFEELGHAAEQTGHSSLVYEYGFALYRRGRHTEAVKVLDRGRGGTTGDLVRAWTLPELPEGEARAYAAYQERIARYRVGLGPLYSQTILRLLGRKREAVEASLQYRKEVDPATFVRREPSLRALDYNCDLLSADELLRGTATSAGDRTQACLFIALTKLAEGDRDGAREHFREGVVTRQVSWEDYHWNRAFLERMAKDSTWPKWIQPKQ
jgi:tetratricopeptide (TPR) repeat protein